MKKIFAILMAMIMLLSCTALADAQSGARTKAQLYINPELFAGYGDETLTLINTLNSLVIHTEETENSIKVSYSANETDFYEYGLAFDEDGLLLFNSMYPNTVIKLDVNKLVEVVMGLLPDEIKGQLAQLGQVGMQVIEALLYYVEDAGVVIGEIAAEAEVDETGANAYITITTHHLAKLLYAWLDRLSNDQVLLPLLSQLYQMSDPYSSVSFEQGLAELKAQMQQEMQAQAQELGTVGVYEDGLEITLGDVLLISMSVYEQDGYECVEALAVISEYGADDWSATYDGIYNGTGNSGDTIIGLTFAMLPDGGYMYEQLYAVNSGAIMALTAEIVAENEAMQIVASFDMAQGENTINLGGISGEMVFADDIEALTTEGKYVLDVFALPADMLLNGLPKLGADIQKAMPELVNMVIDAINEMTGLDINLDIPAANNNEIVENNTDIIDTPSVPANQGGIEDL